MVLARSTGQQWSANGSAANGRLRQHCGMFEGCAVRLYLCVSCALSESALHTAVHKQLDAIIGAGTVPMIGSQQQQSTCRQVCVTAKHSSFVCGRTSMHSGQDPSNARALRLEVCAAINFFILSHLEPAVLCIITHAFMLVWEER